MSLVEPAGELFRSGAPIWSFTSYRTVFAVASGGAIAGWIVAAFAWWRRARARSRRASWGVDIAGLVAVAIVAGWTLAVAVGSGPPADGRFCYTPATWTGIAAPSCVAERPVRLMAATLAWPLAALAAALAVRSAASRERHRVALHATLAIAALVAAFGLGPAGLVTPDVFSAGGITASHRAAVELAASLEGAIASVIALAVFAAAGQVRGRGAIARQDE